MVIDPVIAFFVTSALLLAGSLTLYDGPGVPPELIWIVAFVCSLAFQVQNNKRRAAEIKNILVPISASVDFLCISLLVLSSCLFLFRGIPLLSGDINLARVEFLAQGSIFAKAFSLLPAVVAIGASCYGNRNGWRTNTYAAVAVVETVLAGNKASVFNLTLAALFGWWSSGRKVPIRVVIVGSAAVVAATLFLFSRVADESEVGQDPKILLWQRLTSNNEFGLRVCYENLDLGGAPTYLAFQSLKDRVSGNYTGYPISTGRVLTTLVYGFSDYYDAVFELTVTVYCDAALATGNLGLFALVLLMPFCVVWVQGKAIRSRDPLTKGLSSIAFSQALTIYSGGNVAAQFLGYIAPSWLLVCVILFTGRFFDGSKRQRKILGREIKRQSLKDGGSGYLNH